MTPDRTAFLIDTYDTLESGIGNAIGGRAPIGVANNRNSSRSSSVA